MDLKSFTTEELERLLEILPEEIRRRESQDSEAEEAERRKRSVFASFQELAKKQGISLADL
jgi:DNA-binding protein H-NS